MPKPENLIGKGFDKNPQNINRSGANKGSRWKKNLLEEILTMPLQEYEDVEFNDMVDKYPEIFNSSQKINLQLYLELKQIKLLQSKDERIVQAAIKEIKDRIEGQSVRQEKIEDITKKVDLSSLTDEELIQYRKLQEKIRDK